jgi:hypothetical protein
MFVRVLRRAGDLADSLAPTRNEGLEESGVACSDLSSLVSMPSMRSMPSIIPTIRWLGYPGSYALGLTFPHGGFYRVNLGVTPSQQFIGFKLSYLVEVLDERNDIPNSVKPFRLQLTPGRNPLPAGKPVHLKFSIWSTDTAAAVTRFETVHEKKLHLFLVRDDLGAFFHEHPVLERDGTFSLTFQFPTAGGWVLFADVAPKGAGSQILSAKLAVSGHSVTPKPLVPVDQPLVQQNDILMRMEPVVPLAHKTNWLVLTLLDAQGRAPSGLEPWLGAPAHLMLVEQDAATFVHSHPSEGSPGVFGQGVYFFETHFPKPGVYKAWLQVQRLGKILTFPFVIQVLESRFGIESANTIDLPGPSYWSRQRLTAMKEDY